MRLVRRHATAALPDSMRPEPALKADTDFRPDARPEAGAPLRVGLIRNPYSQRNRALTPPAAPLVAPDGIELIQIEPGSKQELPEIVAAMQRHGVTHLVIDGGDGTLRDVMSALPPAYGDALPTLSICAGGNANLTSADVGAAGHGPEALKALLASLAVPGAGQRTRRRPIEVRWPDGSHAPVLGFFVGTAGFYRGWKLAVGPIRDRGFLHSAGITVAVASAAWQTLFGGKANEWRAGRPMDVRIDAQPVREGQRFVFLATTLHRLVGSLWPFYDYGECSIRWLDVDAPPPRFASAIPALLRGRPTAWMRASGAYRGGGAERIELRIETPLVVDGEAFTPGAYGIVELHAGPELEFYAPGPAR